MPKGIAKMKRALAFIVTVLRAGHAGANIYPTRFRSTQGAGSNNINPELPVIPSRKFVITSFGAIGDGKHSKTEAFHKAIASCRDNGGGEVIVPAGTFLTGPIELTSNMALVLEKGATIRGSENFKDYEITDRNGKKSVVPLIGGKKLTNVAIRGEGTIDGAGGPWWKRFRAERAAGVREQGQPRAPG